MFHELTSNGHFVHINGFPFNVKELDTPMAEAAMDAEYGSCEAFKQARDAYTKENGIITYNVDEKSEIRMTYE